MSLLKRHKARIQVPGPGSLKGKKFKTKDISFRDWFVEMCSNRPPDLAFNGKKVTDTTWRCKKLGFNLHGIKHFGLMDIICNLKFNLKHHSDFQINWGSLFFNFISLCFYQTVQRWINEYYWGFELILAVLYERA